MNTAGFSLEIETANDGGANTIAGPLKRAIVVNGYQVSASLNFPKFGLQSPPANAGALCQGFFTATKPVFNGGLQQGGGVVSLNGDWDGSQVVSPDTWFTGVQGQFVPGNGLLFSRIMKTTAPAAACFDIAISGLSVSIPVGCYIVIHMDIGIAGLPMPIVDSEIQGTLFYT